VAVADALILALALLGAVCLPVVMVMVICADELLDRASWAIAQRREARRERRTLGKLKPDEADPSMLAELADNKRSEIGYIAAALRRLDRQRLSIDPHSSVEHAAVLRAYDDQLRLACASLDVSEHLRELAGVDLEIERVRVEGELLGLGLALRWTGPQKRQDTL
jgi:hypothetical protein